MISPTRSEETPKVGTFDIKNKVPLVPAPIDNPPPYLEHTNQRPLLLRQVGFYTFGTFILIIHGI